MGEATTSRPDNYSSWAGFAGVMLIVMGVLNFF